jgi:hypothetical protein
VAARGLAKFQVLVELAAESSPAAVAALVARELQKVASSSRHLAIRLFRLGGLNWIRIQILLKYPHLIILRLKVSKKGVFGF